MAETVIMINGTKAVWQCHDMARDLDIQGGYKGVVIHSQNAGMYQGYTVKNTLFRVIWVKELFMLVSMSQDEKGLVDAFSKVLDHKPFCRYVSKTGWITYEWDMNDPQRRFEVLKSMGEWNLEPLHGT